jgi:hypothetical protein
MQRSKIGRGSRASLCNAYIARVLSVSLLYGYRAIFCGALGIVGAPLESRAAI